MSACSVQPCVRPLQARGLCGTHYFRWWKHGDPTASVRPTHDMNPDSQIRFYGWTVTDSGCWEFNKRGAPGDYREIRIRKKTHMAHRLAYETWVGAIPEGHVVRHKCDNPPCINPDHLETGTPAENSQDRDSRGRSGSAKLSEQDVLDIRREYDKGVLTQQMLADAYGVTASTLNSLVLRKTWKRLMEVE